MILPGTNPESSVLSLMLDAGCRKWARLALKPGWFASQSNRWLFEAAIAAPDEPPLTIAAWADAVAYRFGMPAREAAIAITEALEHIGSSHLLGAYGKLLREADERERMRAAARGVLLDESAPPEALASKLRAAAEIPEPEDGHEIALQSGLPDPMAGDATPTGFHDIDRLLGGGLRPGWLFCIAARTSMGKTALAVDILRRAASAEIPAGIVTLEMMPQALWARLALVPFSNRCSPLAWYPPSATTAAIHGKLHQWKARGVKLAVLDYLQLVRWPDGARSNYEATTRIVKEIQAAARDTQLPLVLVCQLSRAVTARADRRPELSDLRDSGAIEEACDQVLLLHRPGYYEPEKADQSEAYAALAKNRHGATGVVRLVWRGELSSFGEFTSAPLPDDIEAARLDF